MTVEKINLPYKHNMFEPIISRETFDYHYGKHYLGYINKLNNLIKNSEFSSMTLEEIICNSSDNIFNNAAQVWNHEFYWMSISNKKDIEEEKQIFFDKVKHEEISLKKEFLAKATSLFGSGWCWLVKNSLNEVQFINTQNADTPLIHKEYKPLFVCDVWEHAYYIDFKNDRPKYLNKFWNLIDWEFVNKNFDNA